MRLLTAFPLAVLIAAGCGRPEVLEAPQGEPPTVSAKVLEVRASPTPTLFEATGTVRAKFNANLSSKVMARVESVSVREGDEIRTGQTLIRLDPRELSASVQVAGANLKSARVGVDNAATAADMEERVSKARVIQAEAQAAQARAALGVAKSRLDLALAGPRTQERTQAKLAVQQAAAALQLATKELDRTIRLVDAGAIAKKSLEQAQANYDIAKAQYDTAVQAEKIAEEGSRSQEIQSARDGVIQAEAAVRQAEAAVNQSKAASLQINVRRQEIVGARAQVSQSAAAKRSAEVLLSYATVGAPFEGRVVRRLADPGTMANPGVPLLEVEGRELRLEALVPESILRHLALGTSVSVRVDAIGRELPARVVEIVPQGDASTHSFIAKLALSPMPELKSGMFGRAFVVTGSAKRILIPGDATWEREGLHYVFAVNAEGIVRLRIVTLGPPVGENAEVLSGLREGDRIVVGSRAGIADGAKVGTR